MSAIIDLGPYALVAAANAVRKVEARRKAPVVLAIGKIEGGERPVACERLPHLLAGCWSGLVVAAKSRAASFTASSASANLAMSGSIAWAGEISPATAAAARASIVRFMFIGGGQVLLG